MKCNILYVGIHECCMHCMHNLCMKRMFFMGKELVVNRELSILFFMDKKASSDLFNGKGILCV